MVFAHCARGPQRSIYVHETGGGEVMNGKNRDEYRYGILEIYMNEVTRKVPSEPAD